MVCSLPDIWILKKHLGGWVFRFCLTFNITNTELASLLSPPSEAPPNTPSPHPPLPLPFLTGKKHPFFPIPQCFLPTGNLMGL